MKKIICLLLSIAIFSSLLTFSIFANDTYVDITKSTVKEDLASMNEDKLSYLSESECIFIAMSQYYDAYDNLRTYVYFNLPTWASAHIENLSISISTSVSNPDYSITENYVDYDLKYVNSEETWYKFEILNLPNVDKTTRRYHLKEIFVKDRSASLNFFVDEVYIFNGIKNDHIQVFNQEIETITITDKEVHFYCHGDGQDFFFRETGLMQPGDIYTDAWYIFFNTDKEMDELLEIELTYQQYNYHLYQTYYGIYMDDEVTNEVISDMKNSDSLLSYDFDVGRSYVNYLEPEVVTITPGTKKIPYTDEGWFGNYDIYYEELDNIMDLRKYKAQDSDKFVFTDYADVYAWGVHFKDTTRSFQDYTTSNLDLASHLDGSGMSDVAILRLKFQTNGIVKNCYAVDTPTDDFFGNIADVDTKYEELFEKLFMVVGILVFVILAGYLLPVFKVVFEGVVFVVSSPFKLLKWLFNTKK